MKNMKWLTAVVLMMGLAVWAGCGKKGGATKAQTTVDVNGVQVAMPELQQALAVSKDPDVQASTARLAFGMRYGTYAPIQEELAKLAVNPNLSDDQKKLVATVQEQIKEVVAKQPAQ